MNVWNGLIDCFDDIFVHSQICELLSHSYAWNWKLRNVICGNIVINHFYCGLMMALKGTQQVMWFTLRGKWMFVQNVKGVHLVVVTTFHIKLEMSATWWCSEKIHRITKVTRFILWEPWIDHDESVHELLRYWAWVNMTDMKKYLSYFEMGSRQLLLVHPLKSHFRLRKSDAPHQPQKQIS